jgi:hypothetical protein
MLKIQEYISCFDSVEEAVEWLSIKFGIETYADLDGNTLLMPGENYDIDSSIASEANYMVLDKDGNLLAKSWDIPRTVNNPLNVPCSFSTGNPGTAYEIPDGEIVVFYEDKGGLKIATRDSADDSWYYKNFEDSVFTVGNEVIAHLNRVFDDWTVPFENIHKSMCLTMMYSSEVTNNINPSEGHQVRLIGAFNRDTYEELSPRDLVAMATGMQVLGPELREYNGYRSLAKHIHSLDVHSRGLMLVSYTGGRLFLRNRIYDAIIKAEGKRDVDSITEVFGSCTNTKEMKKVSELRPRYNRVYWLMEKTRWKIEQEMKELWEVNRNKSRSDFDAAVKMHPLGKELSTVRAKDYFSIHALREIESIAENLSPIVLSSIAKTKYGSKFEEKFKRVT